MTICLSSLPLNCTLQILVRADNDDLCVIARCENDTKHRASLSLFIRHCYPLVISPRKYLRQRFVLLNHTLTLEENLQPTSRLLQQQQQQKLQAYIRRRGDNNSPGSAMPEDLADERMAVGVEDTKATKNKTNKTTTTKNKKKKGGGSI